MSLTSFQYLRASAKARSSSRVLTMTIMTGSSVHPLPQAQFRSVPMPARKPPAHWLDHYASKEYEWRFVEKNGQRTFYRPLGLVESTFDADGRHYEGRADINASLELEVRSTLKQDELHGRILLAWTCLRFQHVLLQAKAVSRSEIQRGQSTEVSEPCFCVELPDEQKEARQKAEDQLVFLGEHYDRVDWQDFWLHCQNVKRVVDPGRCLAKLFVHSVESRSNTTGTLRLLLVGSHEIWDGLSQYIWLRDLVNLLNKPSAELEGLLVDLQRTEGIKSRLPLPQEALYPPISGSLARQRWYWLLTRILRHVRKPLQAGFSNPLQRKELIRPVSLSPTYSAVLDYSTIPPLNTFLCSAAISRQNTQRLFRLCREAKVSIGSGCFALAALTMMKMYELAEPNVPLARRKPFISGFPLNPRAFFNHHNEPNSLMLAFCDGIELPFLPSSLDLDGRIRLLARQAHRQLASYQKRTRPKDAESELQYMSSRGAGRVLGNQYVGSIERVDSILPEHLRRGINPQGAYPMRPNMTRQTCGVSSVGRSDTIIKPGMYDVNDTSKEFIMDFRGTKAGVRAREGEFLIGIGGSEAGLGVNVSVDASSLDLALIEVWKQRLEHVLDEDKHGRQARL